MAPADPPVPQRNPERVKRLARSFAQEWLRPNDPDAATPALVDTLTTVMLAFYAAVATKPDPPVLVALDALLREIPRYKVSELDDMLLPTPQPDGEWVLCEHIEAALRAAGPQRITDDVS